MKREALDEGTAASGAEPGCPGRRNLDTLELEELEGFRGSGLFLEDAACAQAGEDGGKRR